MGGKPFLADGAYEPQKYILKKIIDFWQWSTAIPLCFTHTHHCTILPRLIATKWCWGEQKENSNIWMMCIKSDCSALHLEAWHKPSSCPSHLPQENSASSNSQVRKKTRISMQWLCSNQALKITLISVNKSNLQNFSSDYVISFCFVYREKKKN